MKFILVVTLLFISTSHASNRADVTIIEARENIQYLSQKMTIDYFLLYNNNNTQLRRNFKQDISRFEDNIHTIRDTTNNSNTHNILDFYDYRLEYIKKLPLNNISSANIKLILDASEYFLEGTKSIDAEHFYSYNQEEKMLELTKEIQFLIERSSKFYIAQQLGIKSDLLMKLNILEVNKIFIILNMYPYPKDLKRKLTMSQDIWQRDKKFFKNPNMASLPKLLLTSTSYLKSLLVLLEKYHKQHL